MNISMIIQKMGMMVTINYFMFHLNRVINQNHVHLLPKTYILAAVFPKQWEILRWNLYQQAPNNSLRYIVTTTRGQRASFATQKVLIMLNSVQTITFNSRDYSNFIHISWYHFVHLIVSCLIITVV